MTLLEKLTEITGNTDIAEKVNSSLGEFMIPKGKFNEVNEKLKTLETETNLETKELRKQLAERDNELENIRTANMTEVEKIQHQLKQATENLAKRDLENNRLEAVNTLAKAGLTDEEIEKIVNVHVSEDAERTREAIGLFVDVLTTKTGAAEQKVKEEIYKKDTDFDDGGDTPRVDTELTLEKFRGMNLQQRTEIYTNQPEVYQEFVKQEKTT